MLQQTNWVMTDVCKDVLCARFITSIGNVFMSMLSVSKRGG